MGLTVLLNVCGSDLCVARYGNIATSCHVCIGVNYVIHSGVNIGGHSDRVTESPIIGDNE